MNVNNKENSFNYTIYNNLQGLSPPSLVVPYTMYLNERFLETQKQNQLTICVHTYSLFIFTNGRMHTVPPTHHAFPTKDLQGLLGFFCLQAQDST